MREIPQAPVPGRPANGVGAEPWQQPRLPRPPVVAGEVSTEARREESAAVANDGQPEAAIAAARVLPIEKGMAMAAAERRPNTAKEESGGMSVRIPLRDIVQILTAILAIVAVVWTLRSDIRDLKTTMDLQNKIQEERWARQLEDMKGLRATQTLQGIDINDLKISLAAAGLYSPKKPVTITNDPPGGGR